MKKLGYILLHFLVFTCFNTAISKENVMVFSAASENLRARMVCTEKLKTALHQMDFELRMNLVTSLRSINIANRGDLDGEVARVRGIEARFPNLLLIDVPCHEHHIHLYVNSGKEFVVNGWESLPKAYVVGYRKGLQYVDIAAKKYDLSVYPVENLKHAFGLLLKKRVDAVLTAKPSLELVTSSDARLSKLVRLEPSIEWHQFYIYLHKKNRHMLPRLTEILLNLEASES